MLFFLKNIPELIIGLVILLALLASVWGSANLFLNTKLNPTQITPISFSYR